MRRWKGLIDAALSSLESDAASLSLESELSVCLDTRSPSHPPSETGDQVLTQTGTLTLSPDPDSRLSNEPSYAEQVDEASAKQDFEAALEIPDGLGRTHTPTPNPEPLP